MATPKVDSIDLANYVLAKTGAASHLKLQKLLYYIQAWHLAYFDEPLIADEFEAWMHGPVSRKVWRHFKDSASPLLSPIEVPPNGSKAIQKVEAALIPDQVEFIGDILQEYGDKSAYHLECLTHAEKPWIEARGDCAPEEACSNRIEKDSMKSFYKKQLYS